MRLKALVLPPKSQLDQVCSNYCRALINEHFDPVWNETGKDYTQDELSSLIGDAEVILSSWGSPVLTEDMLEKAERLRFLGHAAGTVKNRVPREAFARNIRIFSAAPRIAQSVGEYCMAVLLSTLRNIPACSSTLHEGGWRASGWKGHELTGSTIGIVSASSTAREFIKYLAPFRVNILLYDPFLSQEAARQLGVKLAALEEVMRCPIISIHAPSLPDTEKMIGKELFELIPQGAVFINSARTSVLDEGALLDELKTGRFMAALDVFGSEPLPKDSPFRQLENVILTPHIAGATVEGHLALMEEVVKDILRGLKGEATKYEVLEKVWDRTA